MANTIEATILDAGCIDFQLISKNLSDSLNITDFEQPIFKMLILTYFSYFSTVDSGMARKLPPNTVNQESHVLLKRNILVVKLIPNEFQSCRNKFKIFFCFTILKFQA